jgi:hypothetical protein
LNAIDMTKATHEQVLVKLAAAAASGEEKHTRLHVSAKAFRGYPIL